MVTGMGKLRTDAVGVDCASVSICGCIRANVVVGATHQTPIGRSAPTGTKLVETVARTASRSPPRLVGVDRVPRRRSSSFP